MSGLSAREVQALGGDSLRELLERATPGPWEGNPDHDDYVYAPRVGRFHGAVICRIDTIGTPEATHRLVVLAPALARRVLELEAENARLLDACVQQEREIQQVLGKALGYPYYADDQVTFPGATRADGVCVFEDTAGSLAVAAAVELGRLRAQAAAVAGLREALIALLAASWDGRTSYWDAPGTAACEAAAAALAQASAGQGDQEAGG